MSKLVQFVKDVYPHCVGDVVKLADDELKHIASSAYKEFSDATVRAEKAVEAEVVEAEAKVAAKTAEGKK
ncbi:hypothetical protein AHiyo8_59280 [Arthrobacter sp. Hiyo8]|uniref:hypothetical protein n=1 Tax=Arthrobacter sp. Hiyo1 TaxID=1588020 RepID=UPI0006838D05|nr:hypothetical protein [Arthrobacter sp. Hiyo1]BAS17625.1 hypothetical protein AHiyo8_59280 [Arthrobacter sp. Hiyo8]GAP57983.1 hypothetical protein AHiyo1_09450 [Arthrobacter sp. Hiyo1]